MDQFAGLGEKSQNSSGDIIMTSPRTIYESSKLTSTFPKALASDCGLPKNPVVVPPPTTEQ
jgi:hypothetical protein